MDSLRLWAVLAFIVSVSVIADWLLKLASTRSNWIASMEFCAGAALYALSAVGWVIAMQHMRLATIAVSYSVLTLALLAALGALVFREELTGRDFLGLAFAAAAVALMSRAV